jgi:peptidoglycan/LPS O-acetylase OafA/YrhL
MFFLFMDRPPGAPELRNFFPGIEQTMYGLLIACMATGIARSEDSLISRLLSIRPVVWLGERTYGMYLSHLLMWPLSRYLGLEALSWKLALTIIFSVVLWEIVEKPISKLRPELFIGK